MRVAFQGEAGAYSEKSLRELLGRNVMSVPRPSFESCYRAVASGECDYAIVPIENSLGGSIHENYDLMLRYDLTIVAEHDFRVRHCLLTRPGLDAGDVRYAISHPQALSQCDNYLRSRGIVPRPTYDTAGSAKMISDCLRGGEGDGVGGGGAVVRGMPEGCTPDNTAAIASNLAGVTFGLECKEEGIEDDDSNFTRFLLLGRRGVAQYLNKKIPSKTSLVFTLPNNAGALYKSLACFSLRDIDMSKIESRPMSAALLNYLRFRNTVTMNERGGGGGREREARVVVVVVRRRRRRRRGAPAIQVLLLPGHTLVGARRGRAERAAPPPRAERLLPRARVVPRQLEARGAGGGGRGRAERRERGGGPRGRIAAGGPPERRRRRAAVEHRLRGVRSLRAVPLEADVAASQCAMHRSLG